MKILGSEITPYSTYLNRRKFIKGSLATALLTTISSKVFANHDSNSDIYPEALERCNSYDDDCDGLIVMMILNG